MKHTVHEVVLKNGAKGLFINIQESNVVSFDINFRAGDYLSPTEKWDTAHVMEHLVLGANKRFESSAEFSKEFTKNGAYNNASTGTYHMSYVAECADFEAERIADLLCLAIEAPKFLPTEFAAEKANVLEELKSRANNHATELSLQLGRAMGQLDCSFHDRAKQLAAIRIEDITEFYASTHTSSNMRFIIAGNLTAVQDALHKRLETIALSQGTGRIPLPAELLKKVAPPLVIQNQTVDNIYYRWETSFGQRLTTDQEDSFEALFSILLSTMHSRIFGVARERGLAYGIGYGKYRTKQTDIWYVAGQVLPENFDALMTLCIEEFQKVKALGIHEPELEEARQRALGTFYRSMQTTASVANFYSDAYIYDDTIEQYEHVKSRIEAVSTASVAELAKDILFSDTAWGIGFYGATGTLDAKKIQAKFAKLYS